MNETNNAENNSKVITSKKRWLILSVLVLMPFMTTLGTSIINVALPRMSQDLNVTTSDIQILVIAYLITIVSTILFFGRLGDIKGKSKMFTWGIVIFTCGSLFAGLCHTMSPLLLARIIQGIGGAMAMASNQGILGEIMPANERGMALGISATFVALGTLCGPPLGGLIITYFDWRYIFFINVPIGIFTAICGFTILPKDTARKEEIDFKGAALLGISLILLFYAFVYGRNIGYTNPLIYIPAVLGIVLFLLFVRQEGQTTYPIIHFGLFKNKVFTIGIFCTMVSHIICQGSSVIQPFYLQNALGLSPKIAGFILMIYAIMLSIAGPISGKLSDKFGTEKLSFIGLITMGLGTLLIATLTYQSPVYLNCIYIAIMGLGSGLFTAPNNSLIISLAPQDKLGFVGSLNAFARNLGNTVGVSLFTVLLYGFMSFKAGTQVNQYLTGQPEIFMFGMRWVHVLGSILAFIGAFLIYSKMKHPTALPQTDSKHNQLIK